MKILLINLMTEQRIKKQITHVIFRCWTNEAKLFTAFHMSVILWNVRFVGCLNIYLIMQEVYCIFVMVREGFYPGTPEADIT